MTCVVLPIDDSEKIRNVLHRLSTMKREGHQLLPEVIDWMDWASNKEDERCSIGINSAIMIT